MKLRHVKSAVLTVLVLLSFLMTYLLWQGHWQTVTEVPYSWTSALPQAKSPTLAQASSPFEIVYTDAQKHRYAVAVRDSSLYTSWMQRLTGAHIYNLRPTESLPQAAGTQVDYTLGTNVSYRELSRWVPGLQTYAFLHTANTMRLVEGADRKSVKFVLTGKDGIYIADTDLSAATFEAAVRSVIGAHEWEAWNPAEDSYVPKSGMTVAEYTAKQTSQSVLPLVHSFFVNPQALTRIDENDHTVLWTDGSRVVWWDKRGNVLSYADPNASQNATDYQPDLATALEFIRNHGGTTSDVAAFEDDSAAKGTTYTLRPFVGGMPVLSTNAEYSVELLDGRAVQFHRPLNEWTGLSPAGDVQIIGAEKLREILHGLMPTTPVETLTVQLGYQVSAEDGGTVRFSPVYNVTESGILLWVIDGETGNVLKGMSSQ